MAQIMVDSRVMRDKAQTLETAAKSISTIYSDMLQEVTTTANKMKRDTIETQKKQFAGMQPVFETIAKDMQAYADFLKEAADQYDRSENEGKQKAEEVGKVF